MIVLIVDDDKMLREAYARMFRLKGGWEIHLAWNGKEALEIIKSGVIPDLVITDLEMPVMSGSEFCKELRDDPKTKDIPVLMVSGSPDIQSIAQFCGATDYIPKWDPKSFTRQIEFIEELEKKAKKP